MIETVLANERGKPYKERREAIPMTDLFFSLPSLFLSLFFWFILEEKEREKAERWEREIEETREIVITEK